MESCVQHYGAHADALRDLLTTAQMLSSMAVVPPPSPTLMTRSKQQFMRAAAPVNVAPTAVPPSATRTPPPSTPPRTGLMAWLRSPGPLGRPTIVGVTLLTLVALLVAFTALSISALPGDLFYPPKVAAETLDLNVKKALLPDQAAEFQEAFDRNRAADVQKAMDLGRQAPVALNGFVVYADDQTLSLNSGIRVALHPALTARQRDDLRQGIYLTVVGHIEPGSRVVRADRIEIAPPPVETNFRARVHPTATFTATRRPLVVPPTRRPTARPTRRPRPTATQVPTPVVIITWTPTAAATVTPSATPVTLTPSATATTSDLTPTATAVDLTPTPGEVTPTASPTPIEATPTATDVVADTPTPTAEPPTATVEPATPTPDPPTATPEPPTATPEPPTVTPEPPTATPEPPPTSGSTVQFGPTWTINRGPGTYPGGARPAVVSGCKKRLRL